MDDKLLEQNAEKLGKYIRECREDRRMSLREVAKLAGFDDHTYIFAVEKGKSKASESLLYKLIDIFDLSFDECRELLALAGIMDPKYLKPIEIEFISVLEKNRIQVGAYGGSLSEETMRILIRELEKWE